MIGRDGPSTHKKGVWGYEIPRTPFFTSAYGPLYLKMAQRI